LGDNEARVTGQDAIEVDGQRVAYEWVEVDVRTEEQRRRDALAGHPAGDPAVVIAGHGETIASPANLTRAAAAHSAAGIAWCIDVLPPRSGDPLKARALSPIVRERLAKLRESWSGSGSEAAQPSQATLIGWSHGGGEALRSASFDPALFPRVAGLCPAGLVERRPRELLASFLHEVLHIVGSALGRRDGAGLRDALRVGFDILFGILRDLVRSRSVRRVVEDIRWAGRKVPGPGFDYPGDVALVFARGDSVIRWQDVFPACSGPEEIPPKIENYRHSDFPLAAHLRVAVLEGDHLSPEHDGARYAREAFTLLGREPSAPEE
jgi:hypothetical protein